MADYIYLLENRLSEDQKRAISTVREIARTKSLTVFLVGGAVRDLTSGSPVRDLDVVVQGNALKLKKDLQKAGAIIAGETEALQALYVTFSGGVRMELGSTLAAQYPKPGKPVMKPATILDDLRRRDFTANAMALSLNEGSYGLLMDPLNGVADIENRELRLVSNYGFIEEPVRMIRAARFVARLGWQMEEKTQARYETGKTEGYISALQDFHRGYEAEEIVHEEDPLRVLRGLEQEGWLKRLVPAWSVSKVSVAELEKLREAQAQLQMQGILADPSAAQFPLLTAKMAPKEVAALKTSFPRQGFVEEIEALESEGKHFAVELGSKQAAKPSQAWKLLFATRPEVVLWVAYSTKSATLQAKFQSFYKEWPQARQRVPYTLMQEMRIVPELAGFDELVEKIFFELMDGKLGTAEEMKEFLEPYSPPAPPPPVHLRKARASKKDAKAAKARKKSEADEDSSDDAEELDAIPEAGDLDLLNDEEEDATAEVEKPVEKKTVVKVTPPAKTATSAKPMPAKVSNAKKAAPAVMTDTSKVTAKKPSSGKPVVKTVVKKTAPTAKVAKKVAPAKVTAHAPAKKVVVPAKAAGKAIAARASTKKVSPKAGSKAVVKAKSKPSAKNPSKAVVKSKAKPVAKAPAKHVAKAPAKTSSKKKR